MKTGPDMRLLVGTVLALFSAVVLADAKGCLCQMGVAGAHLACEDCCEVDSDCKKEQGNCHCAEPACEAHEQKADCPNHTYQGTPCAICPLGTPLQLTCQPKGQCNQDQDAESPALVTSFPHVPAVDILREFELESSGVEPYPFKPFPKEYVNKALKEGVDWTTDPRGIVTPVKNQGPHGYCGTFGRVESAEGQYNLHSGQPSKSLSVEQLIDCVGWDLDQMPSILGLPSAKTPGLMSWEDYPYNITKYPDRDPPIPGNPCRFEADKVVANYAAHITNMTGVNARVKNGEDQFAAFVHHNGPCSFGINANVFSYKDKTSFVDAKACEKVKGKPIDHSVLAVGFGVDETKGPYWKIKNSWGAKWGANGYVKVARGIKCAGISSAFGHVPTYGDPSKYYE